MQRAECDLAGTYDLDCWDADLIVPGLYVGSLRSALDTEKVVSNGITHVLTVADRLHVSVSPGIRHHVIDIADHPAADLLSILDIAMKFIDESLQNRNILGSMDAVCANECAALHNFTPSGAVLVHCASGVSRSVSVCCAWLMTRKSMSLQESLNFIKMKRRLASPNIGFKVQLQCLQDTGGSIIDASTRYCDSIGCHKITDLIFELREDANKFHEIIDNIENKIQIGMCTNEFSDLLLSQCTLQLLDVQLKLETNSVSSKAAVINTIFFDPPSVTIRKSASNKCYRLLQYLESINKVSSLTGEDFKADFVSLP